MRWLVSLGAMIAACALVACGGGSDDKPKQPSVKSRIAASATRGGGVTTRAADFPKAGGRTLAQLSAKTRPSNAFVALAVSQFEPGENRLGFALFTKDHKQVSGEPVALYVAPKGGGPAKGPYPANGEPLSVKPQYRSRSVADDPDAAQSLYVAHVPLPKTGSYDVLAMSKLEGQLVRADTPKGLLKVRANSKVPDVGDMAPKIDTPTTAEVGGNVQKIDTRFPPSTLHAQNVKDVLGKKPVILIFATPALCQSRVCGPVVDIAEEVKDERKDQADFIHQEIYNGNKINGGFRPQVRAYDLPTEPWLFAIDRRGKIVDRIEGAFDKAELERAVDKAVHD